MKEKAMEQKTPFLKSLGFSIIMTVISLLLLADYARLAWTTGNFTRFGFGVVAWLVMSVVWVSVSVIRARGRAPAR